MLKMFRLGNIKRGIRWFDQYTFICIQRSKFKQKQGQGLVSTTKNCELCISIRNHQLSLKVYLGIENTENADNKIGKKVIENF